MQGFKTKLMAKKGQKAHQERKNKPKPKKISGFRDQQHKKLSASIDKNIESLCADKVAQTKQHLKVVKMQDRSKVIRK